MYNVFENNANIIYKYLIIIVISVKYLFGDRKLALLIVQLNV